MSPNQPLAFDEALRRAARAALERQAQFAMSASSFETFLRQRLVAGRQQELLSSDALLDDLCLACGCAQGLPGALALFETRFFPMVQRSAARNRQLSVEPADVLQALREKLFVKNQTGHAGIAQYSGKSSLATWFHVVAARHLLNAAQRKNRELPSDEDVFLELVSPDANPEMARIKAQHREELKAALRTAFAGLSAADRNLLRHRFLDELSLAEVSALYRVDRSTISRWLLRVRSALFVSVRAELLERSRGTESELGQLLHSVQVSFELSLGTP